MPTWGDVDIQNQAKVCSIARFLSRRLLCSSLLVLTRFLILGIIMYYPKRNYIGVPGNLEQLPNRDEPSIRAQFIEVRVMLWGLWKHFGAQELFVTLSYKLYRWHIR